MNANDKNDLPERTSNYALRIIRLYLAVAKNTIGVIIGKHAGHDLLRNLLAYLALHYQSWKKPIIGLIYWLEQRPLPLLV